MLAAAGGNPDADTPRVSRSRLSGFSFLHRFGSALNHHVHLHEHLLRYCAQPPFALERLSVIRGPADHAQEIGDAAFKPVDLSWRQKSSSFGLSSGSKQSALSTPALRLSMTVVRGTPPKCSKAFSRRWMKSSADCVKTASLQPQRECERTTRITCVLRRLPSGPMTGAPVPKSTWASNPGGLSIRRNGVGGAAPCLLSSRRTLS